MSPINNKTLPKEVTVVPAYGRTYTGVDQVVKAWRQGRDFIIVGLQGSGTYINKEDADRFGVSVRVRYNNKTRVTTIHPNTNGKG